MGSTAAKLSRKKTNLDIQQHNEFQKQWEEPPKYINGSTIQLITLFIHEFTKSWIPNELTQLIVLYYGNNTEQQLVHLLRFSVVDTRCDILQYYHENKCVKVINPLSDGYLFVNAAHVMNGIHCWRVHIENPNKGEIMCGVTQPQFFMINDLENRENQKIWGVSHKKFYYKNDSIYAFCVNQNDMDLLPFKQEFCCIDILLNVDEGTLQIAVIEDNECDIKNVARFWNLPNNEYGWTPCIYYKHVFDVNLRIAKITTFWFSKYKKIWIT